MDAIKRRADHDVEISRVKIDGVVKQTLGEDWVERLQPPGASGAAAAPSDPAEQLRSDAARIAAAAVRAAGCADHLDTEVYGYLLTAVSDRWLRGKATGFAAPEDIDAALHGLGDLGEWLVEHGEIVRGMLADGAAEGDAA